MLSFSRGKPIAVVRGGRDNGRIIHLYDSDAKCCAKCGPDCEKKRKCCKECKYASGGCGNLCGGSKVEKKKSRYIEEDSEYEDPDYDYDPYNYLDSDFFTSDKDGYRMGFNAENELHNALKEKRPPKGGKGVQKMYEKGKKILDERLKREIHIDDGVIQMLPRVEKDQVENLYIAAPSGAGKSTFTNNYGLEYKKIHPKNRVIFFSRSTEPDKAFAELKPKIFKIDESLIEDPIDGPKELKNTLCIFDDIDTFKDKKVGETVRALRDDILQTGRKSGISSISTSHQVLNYKRTREVLNECQGIVLFPRGGGIYAIHQFLKKYCGLTEDQIKRMIRLPSRWICIYKTYPMYVLYEKGAFLL